MLYVILIYNNYKAGQKCTNKVFLWNFVIKKKVMFAPHQITSLASQRGQKLQRVYLNEGLQKLKQTSFSFFFTLRCEKPSENCSLSLAFIA